jgi:hypothetical protein
MKCRTWSRTATALTLTAGLVLAGAACSSGGSSASSLGNKAVSATLGTLFESFVSGGATVNPAITSGVIPNPFAAPAGVSLSNVNLGGDPDDGNATVDVLATVTHDPDDGSRTVNFLVDETGGTHVFLSGTLQLGALSLSARSLPLSFSGISPTTGTGEAFVVARVRQDGTINRTFVNTSAASGKTLIDATIAPQPASALSGSFSVELDLFLNYVVTSGSGGLVARLASIDVSFASSTLERAGGPAAAALGQAITSLLVNNTAVDTGSDIVFAVGTDAVGSGGFGATDPVQIDGMITGGVTGLGVDTTVGGDLVTGAMFSGTTINVADVLDLPAPDVNDADLDFGQITFSSRSAEVTPSLDHTLGNNASFDDAISPLDLSELLWFPSTAETSALILVVY